MVKHKHKGLHCKTRHMRRKSIRERGMTAITKLLAKYQVGDRVHISVNPSVHGAQPFRRFHGKTGVVTGKQGSAYTVKIKDMNATKEIIVGTAHMQLSE